MGFFTKIADSFSQLLPSPAKRRRTIATTTPVKDDEPTFLVPATDPQGSKAQAIIFTRVTKKYINNPRKRAYQEDELETTVTIKPDDSVSQVEVAEEGSGVEEDDGDSQEEDVEEGSSIEKEARESNNEDQDDEQSSASVDVLGSDEEDVDIESSSVVNEDDFASDQEGEVDVEGSNSGDEGDLEDEVFDEEPELDEAEIAAREAAAAEAKVQEYLARQAELAIRREDIENAKAAGDWHPDALVLFERILLVSYEEVLPEAFKIDFPTLPEDIFAPANAHTFVNTNYRSTLSGVKALQGLLRLGMRARERVEATGFVGKVIAKGIQDYIKWSERDGGFDKLRFLPVLVVVNARPNQTVTSISKAIEQQLIFLAEKHREYLALPTEHINEVGEVEKYRRQPPLLYGIIVAQTIVIFVTMDSADPKNHVKHLHHFDFKDKKIDVWNGFKLAYAVIMARDYVMAIKDEFEEEPEETDPDL